MMKMFILCFRAPRELDGHQGDTLGRDGVQREVSGMTLVGQPKGEDMAAACYQEDCNHGQSSQ